MPKIKLFNNLDDSLTEIEIPCKFGRVNGELTFPSDDSVSTLHGEFKVEGDRFILIDLNSTNGTYINESQLLPNDEKQLEDDDLVEFGEQSFHIGVSESFNPEDVQLRYQKKKTERVRDKLSASKAEKLSKIQSQIKTLTEKKDKINEQLDLVKEKFNQGQKAQNNLIEKKTLIDQKIEGFQELLAKANQAFDEKKRNLYKDKANIDDEIKLLNLSGEEGEKINSLKTQLAEVEKQIAQITQEKKDFPNKIEEFKKNQGILSQTIQETSLKLQKVKSIITENEKKYLPMIEKITLNISILEKEKSRLEADVTKTRPL